MEQMNGLDAFFIAAEDAVNHMHIGAVSIFEGPTPAFAEVRAAVASKLAAVRRYRQRVRELPMSIGRPVWIDDIHFDLDYHLRRTALPEPRDDALDTLVGRLMSQPLDRHKPLWEMWVVEGLPEGRWAIVSKVHHCIVDGVAGSDLMAHMMSNERDTEVVPPADWEPEPEPSRAALARAAAALSLQQAATVAQGAGWAVVHPIEATRTMADTMSGARRLGNPIHHSPLTGPIGPHRRWVRAHCALDDITRIRKTLGGTVNDVVLTVAARGFRSLLVSRRVAVADRTVNTIIPVSVREAHEHGTLDNRVAALYAHLPVGIATAADTLTAVAALTAELKRSHELEAARAFVQGTGLVPPALGAALVRALVHGQGLIETIVTNVPGPHLPLYLCRRRLEQTYPYLPIAGNICIDIAVWSYHGNVFFGVTGDWDRVPDLGAVARGIEEGIGDLVAAAA